jgi:hypothetical protein
VRELYDYPVMQVKLNAQEFKDGKATWNFKLREWIWYSEFTAGKLSFIAGKDEQGALRFKWGEMKAKSDG